MSEVVGILLSLAGLVVSLVGPIELLPIQKLIIVTFIIAIVILLLLQPRRSTAKRLPQKRRLGFIRRRLLAHWLHADQAQAARENPHYQKAMKRQVPLLGLTARSLAEAAGISRLASAFLIRNPEYIPHYEYLNAFEEAFLLPKGYFRQGGGGGYDPATCIRRILHYDKLGVARARTMVHRIHQIQYRELKEAVRVIESQRWEELRREGKVP